MENVHDAFTVLDDSAGRQLKDTSVLEQTTSKSMGSRDNEGLFYVPPGLVALLSIIYGSVSVVAVVGNLLVIVVVLASARMRTVTNYFIANLSIADVMIGCLSIPFQFQAALLQRWDLPEILHPPPGKHHVWKITTDLVGPARDPVSGGAVRQGSECEREHSDSDGHFSRSLPRYRSATQAGLDRSQGISHRGRSLGDQRGVQPAGNARLQGGLDCRRCPSSGGNHRWNRAAPQAVLPSVFPGVRRHRHESAVRRLPSHRPVLSAAVRHQRRLRPNYVPCLVLEGSRLGGRWSRQGDEQE